MKSEIGMTSSSLPLTQFFLYLKDARWALSFIGCYVQNFFVIVILYAVCWVSHCYRYELFPLQNTTHFVVNVIDKNDNKPTLSSTSYLGFVKEEQPAGTTVTVVSLAIAYTNIMTK